MTAEPRWESSDQQDLLSLVAVGPMAPDTADREWEHFRLALYAVAEEWSGLITPNRLRSLVRGHVAPQRIGAFTNRALSRGLIEATGDWEVSDDREGRNAGRPARVYRWVGGAS